MTGCLLSVMSADAREAFPFLPAFVPKARSRAAVTRAADTRRACWSIMPKLSPAPAQWHGSVSPLLADPSPLATAFFPHFQGGPWVFQELPAPPVADLAVQQPADVVADGRHDEHGRDAQLAPGW